MEQVVVPAGESEYALAMLFSLNLSNPISYIRQDHGLGDILDMIPGSEVCFCYDFGYDDVIFRISRRWSAFRAPYSDDEKRIIEAGGIPPERCGYGLSIPAGDYSLLQYGRTMMPDIAVLVRLFRDNFLHLHSVRLPEKALCSL